VVNEDFSNEFAAFSGKALLCWGESDTATPLSSGKKIEELMKDSKLVVYKGDHYFFLQHAKDVAKNIEETFLKTLEH
jgi:pimeloyl-ACP methyl ester carboxylesterase